MSSAAVIPQVVATNDPKPVDPRATSHLKHGLTGARLYFQTQEDAGAYEELKTALLKELAPETEIMRDLALQIVCDRYRLMSAAELESKIFQLACCKSAGAPEHMVQADTWLRDGDQIARLELYSSRIQRRYEKNFALYRQLQAERKAAVDAAVEEAAQLAQLAASEAETHPARLVPTEPFKLRNFDFSRDEIALLLSHHLRLNAARALTAASPKLRKAA